MFIIRTLFWLSVVILLLPSDETGQAEAQASPQAVSPVEAIVAAQGAVHDVTRFCDRNPAVCDTGQKTFGLITTRARDGARLIYDWAADNGVPVIGETAVDIPMDGPRAARSNDENVNLITGSTDTGAARTQFAGSSGQGSRDTLTPDDLVPVWGGPAPNGRA